MKKVNWFSFLFANAKLARSQLILVTRFMAVMMKAGDSLEQALEAIAEIEGMEKHKDMFMNIRAHVLNGETLSSVLNEYPHVFPEVYRKTVATFEGTGQFDLALTLNSVADDMEARVY